jgi:hypothetical protein
MESIPLPPTHETASIDGRMSAMRRKNFHAIGARNDRDLFSSMLIVAPPREDPRLRRHKTSVRKASSPGAMP